MTMFKEKDVMTIQLTWGNASTTNAAPRRAAAVLPAVATTTKNYIHKPHEKSNSSKIRGFLTVFWPFLFYIQLVRKALHTLIYEKTFCCKTALF